MKSRREKTEKNIEKIKNQQVILCKKPVKGLIVFPDQSGKKKKERLTKNDHDDIIRDCGLVSHVRFFRSPMDCSLPGSSVLGILQARILGWVATDNKKWCNI